MKAAAATRELCTSPELPPALACHGAKYAAVNVAGVSIHACMEPRLSFRESATDRPPCVSRLASYRFGIVFLRGVSAMFFVRPVATAMSTVNRRYDALQKDRRVPVQEILERSKGPYRSNRYFLSKDNKAITR